MTVSRQRPAGGIAMSEYQYYEFHAVDRPANMTIRLMSSRTA
jgi:hypothetical protein